MHVAKWALTFALLTACDSPKIESIERFPDNNIPEIRETTVEQAFCDADTVLVDGDYCTNVVQKCQQWLDPPGGIIRRCKTYFPTARCSAPEKHLRFCIDVNEFVEHNGTLPLTNVSWTESRALCQLRHMDLCTFEQWTLACEGPERLPYPLGLDRNCKKCYCDRIDLLNSVGEMIDHREPIDGHPQCLSHYGVHNLVGNAGEWVIYPLAAPPFRSGGQGGWWGPLRNRCRAITVGHDEYFKHTPGGFRCCGVPQQ